MRHRREVAALLHHLVERQGVLAGEREHHLEAEAREDRAFADDAPELGRELVTELSVGRLVLRVAAEELHPLDRRLAIPHHTDLYDRRHEALDRLAYPVIAVVVSRQFPLADDMLDALVDLFPGMRDQLVVNAPVGERERRQSLVPSAQTLPPY